MPIRWKLLALLLAIALIPLLFLGWFGQRVTRQAGQELAGLNRQILMDGASRNLIQVVRDYATILRREREILELVIHIQARAVERVLAGPVSPPGQVYFDQHLDSGRSLPPGMIFSSEHFLRSQNQAPRPLAVSYLAQVFKLAPGVREREVAQEIKKLSSLLPTYRYLQRQHPSLIFWQSTSLAAGLHSSYPAHGGFPKDYDPRTWEWYVRAMEAGTLIWTTPRPDTFTSQMILTVAQPVEGPDGRLAGVTAIDVPLPALLQATKIDAEWSAGMRTMIVDLSFKPNSDELGLRIIADYSARTAETPWEVEEGPEWLQAGDEWHQEAMIQEMIAGQSGVQQMPHRGRESLWAYGPVDNGRTYLVFILPQEEIVAEAAAAEQYVLDRTSALQRVTGLLLLVVILIVTLLAFIGSRSVTKPIRALLAVARRISEGDLEARTNIRTGDELEELGRSFNDMVPKLQDQIRLRQSLSLAMEVQQNLLPAGPPTLPGFDLAGRSIYSEQTGGDYYDFIPFSGEKPHLLGVALGDVTGHGIAAALLMTTARAMLRSFADGPGHLTAMMTSVNRRLTDDAYAGRYMTLFYLALDARRRTINWVSAGHDPALVYDPAEGVFEELAGSDIPLGIEGDWTFTEFSRDGWRPGQVIVLGTDGIWETRSPEGEMFGKERLREAVERLAAGSAEEIIEGITQTLDRFRQDQVQADDVTVVVIKVGEGDNPENS